MKKTIVYVFVQLFFLTILIGVSQSQTAIPVVQYAKYFDISKPLTEMLPSDNTLVKQWKDGIVKNKFRYKLADEHDMMLVMSNVQRTQGGIKSNVPSVNIEGCRNSDNDGGVAPPDTQGDVGPNHYVQAVNNITEIFDKNGNSIWGPQNTSVFWDGFEGPWSGTNDGDPIVLYDEQSDRWLISQFAVNTGDDSQWELIAISTTGDPTGAYYRYAFEFEDMPDYPKFGIWHDGYYMSANRFTVPGGSFNGTYACAFDRDAMLTGDPEAQMIKFDNSSFADPYALLPADCDGEFPESGTPNYFIYDTDDNTYWSEDRIKVWAFSVDWDTPANSTFSEISSLIPTSFNSSFGSGIEQPGTSQNLSTLADRMMFRAQYRKFTNHESIVLSRTVNVGSNQAGVRWYELRKTTGDWTIHQEGTYAPDDDSRWMSSIAMNGLGDIALGYSVSGASTFPSIRYTGRLASDPLNTMTFNEESIFEGTGSQSGTNRWGDYSMMSVDPSDDASFWYTTEYSNGGWSWITRIAKFTFPESVDPGNLAAVALSTSQIDLNWELNDNNDDVLLAWSEDNNFGIPEDGTTYTAGQSIPGGGIVLQYGSATSYSHIDLSASTYYYYKAWSNVEDQYSSGVTTSAVTDCGVVSMIPWTEDFETDEDIPLCWSEEIQSGEVVWKFGDMPIYNAFEGDICAYKDDITGEDDLSYLILPQFNFSSYSNIKLNFWHIQPAFFSEQDELEVLYKSDYEDSWSVLETYDQDVAEWTYRSLSLPNLSDDYYIAFAANTKNGKGVGLDLISIEESVSINEAIDEDFKITPNPSQGIITFLNLKQYDVHVNVYNTIGKKLYNQELKSNTIDLSFLSKGIYIIEIIHEFGSISRKLVIE
jgi:hypothetical protein